MKYEPVIGLEIHVELKTKSGMFCGCKNDQSLDKQPNIYTCPVCLGLPGALPVPNKKAIEWTIMLGLALKSQIAEVSKFDRKHYFYPDLPKGYQISQYDMPLCVGGYVDTTHGKVRLHRIHLEEDTGTLKHTTIDGKRVSLVDFNRSGTPLVEIVTEPDIKSSEQAKEFLKKLHQLVRDLDISDADMEKGSMRIEPNISIRLVGSKELPKYKVEVKNINSFKFAATAIDYEIKRHAAILEKGEVPKQETRGWDENKSVTVSQRSKEEAADYRYFPEPDIPPLRISQEYKDEIKARMPVFGEQKYQEFSLNSNVTVDQAEHLFNTNKAKLYAGTISLGTIQAANISNASVYNYIVNNPVDDNIKPIDIDKLIISKYSVEQVNVVDLQNIISKVIEGNPKAVVDYKNGKEQSAMFLMGIVRRQLPKADTKIILDALKNALNSA